MSKLDRNMCILCFGSLVSVLENKMKSLMKLFGIDYVNVERNVAVLQHCRYLNMSACYMKMLQEFVVEYGIKSLVP